MSMAVLSGGKSGARREIVESVVRQLVSFDDRVDGFYVTTPLLYPSGASVVVRADGGPDRFLVSDFGMGYHEADMMGATPQFSRHARGIAENAGVGFDDRAFFVVEVAIDQLVGAITTIANCSHEAMVIAAFRLAEKTSSDEADQLYERLIKVFDRRAVSRDAQVIGSSSTPWPVVTLVTIDGRSAIFEPVKKNHMSVVNASAKLNDIANLDHPPSRTAVVSRKDQFGTYLALLSQSANVIERSAPDDIFRERAWAA